MAEQNITEPAPAPEKLHVPDPPELTYEQKARDLEAGVRRLPLPGVEQALQNAPHARRATELVTSVVSLGPAVPSRAIPADRVDRALEALADCIGSAVVSTHPQRFQAIRRIAKLAELLSREKADRGVLDVVGQQRAYMAGGLHDEDLMMDNGERQGGILMPGFGGNDGAQMAREMTMVLQEQVGTQKGKNRASELSDLQNLRAGLEMDLKNKKRLGSPADRERLQSELDVIQRRIDAILDEIKRELPPEEAPKDALVHP